MSVESERAEIQKAKNTANKIIRDAEERRKWIIDQADIHAEEKVKTHTEELQAKSDLKVYDIKPLEKELSEHRKSDIETVKAEYSRNEAATVEFLIGRITDVKVEIQRNIKAEYEEQKK